MKMMGKRNGMAAVCRLSAVMLLILMLTGCLTGCEENTAVAETEDIGSGPALEIGLSLDSLVIERWIRDRDVFVSTAKNLGANVNVQNANGDVDEQIEQIEYFIKKQMDVIVVVAGDCDKLSEVMKKAKDAGIKTMSYDRLVRNADCDMYISFDNEEVGVLMAQALREAIPEGGDILMIQGPTTDRNVEQVRSGFCRIIDQTNLNIVYQTNCDGWLPENAFIQVKEGLEEHKNIRGIMCGNDDLATQAFRVLSEEQLVGSVVLVGQDGDLIACQRIMEGTQQMTAFKSVTDEARLAAEYAVMLANGEPLAGIGKTISDGTYDVPCLELMPVALTRDNMEQLVIQGGYHAREDVYLNVK